mmetsp:Transcript_36352/g.87899  ORF Transcript_36352/g.87899 Transcript_36352/m.87899 type:complete len:243 (+) Transcript_36352:1115-1843(+)
MSRILFSTASVTSALFSSLALARWSEMATSTRSLMIVSTSLPWNPTSVYLVASTLTKGAPAILARRRATSDLPTPVGPIIRMFLGITSSFRGLSSFILLHLLRMAMAMARLASFCPTMCLLSDSTISLGVMSLSALEFFLEISRVMVGRAGSAFAFEDRARKPPRFAESPPTHVRGRLPEGRPADFRDWGVRARGRRRAPDKPGRRRSRAERCILANTPGCPEVRERKGVWRGEPWIALLLP